MATSCARRVFRASLVGVVLAFTILLPVQSLHADQLITTPPNTTNSFGQPIQASASFTVFPDRVLVRLTNQTPFLTSAEQTLRGISFRVRTNKPLEGHMGKSAAKIRMVTADGIKDSKDAIDVPGRVHLDGTTVHIDAPGRKFGLIADPPPQGQGHYPNAEPGLLHPSNNPYLSGTMVMEVVFPGSPLTYGITEVKYVFELSNGLTSTEHNLTSPTASAPLIAPETPPGNPNNPGDTEVPVIWVPEGPFTPPLLPPALPPPVTVTNPQAPPPTTPDSRTPQPPLSTGPQQPGDPDRPVNPLPTGDPPPIPEPATLGILGASLCMLLVRRPRGYS